MRYLIAILVMMTVLLASISCRQAGEGKILGNGDLEPITQAQPASTEPEAGLTGGEPASTELETASTEPEAMYTEPETSPTGGEPASTELEARPPS